MNIKLVESAKSAVEKSKVLSDSEKENLFIKMLTGEDATGEVETSRGTFTVKYPKEKDRLEIGRLMSINRGGLPVASFDVDTENRNLICSTLNVLVVKCPDWFEKAKEKNKGLSFEEVPDDEFLVELYRKVGEFRIEVQKIIKTNKGNESGGVSTSKSVDDNLESGLFNGISSEDIVKS